MAPINRRKRTYQIFGNVLDLQILGDSKSGKYTKLYKRYFVSPEFVQLFFLTSDDKFDETMFNNLSDKEKSEFAHVVNFLNLNSRDFQLALSKMNRVMFSRMQLIEGAIKAGNLNKDLVDEYIEIIKSMKHYGMIPPITASKNIKSIQRTYDLQNKELSNNSN